MDLNHGENGGHGDLGSKENRIDLKDPINQLTSRILEAAIEVHDQLGPGLLESAYEACLCRELAIRGVPFERQVPVPVAYKGEKIDVGFRMDLWVDRQVVIEMKAIDRHLPIHKAQVLTYLKIVGCRVGLILNFGAASMRLGMKRVVL